MSWVPHVVVATVVEQAGRFLVVEEHINGELRLNQPAGHWEPGETLAEGAVRETREESGWDVRVTDFLGVYTWQPEGLPYPFVRFSFVAEALRHHPQQALDEGIVRALWMDREELLASRAIHRGPSVLQCVDDYLAGRRYPLDLLRQFSEIDG